jgi:hypothetical protein
MFQAIVWRAVGPVRVAVVLQFVVDGVEFLGTAEVEGEVLAEEGEDVVV